MSVVDVSFSVFEKFNPTQSEVKQFIEKLNSMLSIEVLKKPNQQTELELYTQEVEKALKRKLFSPKCKL
jgi:hypothetical protein